MRSYVGERQDSYNHTSREPLGSTQPVSSGRNNKRISCALREVIRLTFSVGYCCRAEDDPSGTRHLDVVSGSNSRVASVIGDIFSISLC